jgi:Ca2+-binding RTX toxin-like protein
MNQSDAQLFKLTATMFNAAMGSKFYQEFSGLLSQIGIDELARLFGASGEATTYLGSTPEAQASALTLFLGLNPDSNDATSGDYIAHTFFLANLQAGMNVGTLALDAVRYLEQDEILPELERTRDYLNNRAEFAYQYSKELGWGDDDVRNLQEVIANVTDDDRSIAAEMTTLSANEFDRLRAANPFTVYSSDDDTITGTDGANYIEAGSGYDTVNAGNGNDIILGQSGDDTLFGEKGQDKLEGGDGADTLYAGSDFEWTYVSGRYTYTVDAWFEVLDGGSGADKIYGGLGSDKIEGGEGKDTIYGDYNSSFSHSNANIFENADSSVKSRLFNDYISGGEGDDTIYADIGSDTVYGGAGNDIINAGYGSDMVYGGDGNDTIRLNDNTTSKYSLDGQGTAYGEGGDDTIYAVGNDNVDGGNGNDTINFYRTNNSSDHGAIISGEGADYIKVNVSSDAFSNLAIDLLEVDQVQDKIDISVPNRVTAMIDIQHFDLATDVIDLSSLVYIYSADGSQNRNTNSAQKYSYSGNLEKNYVQIVSAEATPWLEYSYSYPDHTTPEDHGKAYFVIQGAHADSASTSDVAALIDNYGNNATYGYGNADQHLFIVNVSESDLGIYLFQDDTGANNRVVADELTPIAVLSGVTTEDITYENAGFLI